MFNSRRSTRSQIRCSLKKLKYFTIHTKITMSESLFNKLQDWSSSSGVFLLILRNFLEQLFYSGKRMQNNSIFSETSTLRGCLCEVRHPTWVGYLTWVRSLQNRELLLWEWVHPTLVRSHFSQGDEVIIT